MVVLVIALINFTSVFVRLVDTYRPFTRWLWPLSATLGFGGLFASAYLWGAIQTDLFWTQFVHLQRLHPAYAMDGWMDG